MYNRDGSYHEQQAIDVTNMDAEFLFRYRDELTGAMEYHGGENRAPTRAMEGLKHPSRINDRSKIPEIAAKSVAEIEARRAAGKRFSVALGDSDAVRYQKLKNLSVVPAIVDPEKVADIDLEAFNTTKKSAIEKPMRLQANLLGITNVDLKNSSISFKFQFSNESLRKSLKHQLDYGGSYVDYAKAMTCFEDLIKNAVLIETHPDYKAGTPKADRNLKQTYVLLSTMLDETGITPVEFEVKENYTIQNQLYLTVMLTKVDPEVVGGAYAVQDGSNPHLFSESSSIMLTELLKYVNPVDGEFLKYVPDEFLNAAQKAAKQDAVARRKARYPSSKLEKHSLNLNDYTIDDILKWSDEEYARAYKELGLAAIPDDILLEDDFDFEDVAEELDEEPEKIEILYRRKGLGGSHIAADRMAVMTEKRIGERIHDSGAKGHPDYARRCITRIAHERYEEPRQASGWRHI